jgi:hypothetical protein
MAMGKILDTIWIQAEAAEQGVRASARQVRRRLALIRRERFRSAAQYRRFVRAAGFTSADVLLSVRVSLLSNRIEHRVLKGVPRRKLRRVFAAYIRVYRDKWTARTLCAPGYAASRCPAAFPSVPPGS